MSPWRLMRQREGLQVAFTLFFVTLFLNLDTSTKNTKRHAIEKTVDHLAAQHEHSETGAAHAGTASIRNWGCDLMASPLIFIHIGKSGGGEARARLAASALNYARGQKWKNDKRDKSYYPVGKNNRTGFFCNVARVRGPSYCNATTPLGGAIACPEPLACTRGKCEHCKPSSDECPVVYAGHVLLGNEVHWLPQPYLSKWWDDAFVERGQQSYLSTLWENTFHKQNNLEPEDRVSALLKTLAPGNAKWCPLLQTPRPQGKISDEISIACSNHLAQLADKEAFRVVKDKAEYISSKANSSSSIVHPHDMIDWSPLYASMPVLRVTVIRDPYSWFMSKFFWHNINANADCADVDKAVTVLGAFEKHPVPGTGWLYRMALLYLKYLCGVDCQSRENLGVASLEQMERQASNNLRQSFAVVGLLNETKTFYKMVSARVKYIDMSLNPEVTGQRHRSGGGLEAKRCKALYSDPAFQAKLRSKSPVIAALDRVYHVALQVNRHQVRELEQCSAFPVSSE